ncbi:hypothetical protein B0I37DRAFT_142825 [Chaetomium sp. MPI-CAGE-AT-0009]|nr:hypothetical protein B0I37DRAFT_142825 [Chaetomium sp. MPI-CAGE-AT-0009]
MHRAGKRKENGGHEEKYEVLCSSWLTPTCALFTRFVGCHGNDIQETDASRRRQAGWEHKAAPSLAYHCSAYSQDFNSRTSSNQLVRSMEVTYPCGGRHVVTPTQDPVLTPLEPESECNVSWERRLLVRVASHGGQKCRHPFCLLCDCLAVLALSLSVQPSVSKATRAAMLCPSFTPISASSRAPSSTAATLETRFTPEMLCWCWTVWEGLTCVC